MPLSLLILRLLALDVIIGWFAHAYVQHQKD